MEYLKTALLLEEAIYMYMLSQYRKSSLSSCLDKVTRGVYGRTWMSVIPFQRNDQRNGLSRHCTY